jgi:DNA polymerase III gamma/tau subunit
MIGQKGIISEMRKRSKTKDFPEVIIFEGNSGTGKTTLAYIIAAILNDPNPIVNEDGSLSPNPSSPSSIAIREEKFNRDTKLYDASSMSKEDVLNLGRNLSNAPMFDEYKIVIIDEAQELSKAGKGVTLELLEKKRKGTYIILCTMAIESFDKAVQSRGHVYKFRSPVSSDIAEYLFELASKTDLPDVPEIEEFFTKGLFLLAENCEGSVRMAVQNLERCIYGEFWTEKQIEEEFKFISNEKLTSLIFKILEKDMSCIKEIKDFGTKDFYYKALKTLNDAYLYSITGFVDQSWKEGFAKKIRSYDLENLISILLEVDRGPYFREDLFFYYLAKAMKSVNERKRLQEDANTMIEELSTPKEEVKKTVSRQKVVRNRV